MSGASYATGSMAGMEEVARLEEEADLGLDFFSAVTTFRYEA